MCYFVRSLDGNTVQMTIKMLGLPRISFTVLLEWFGVFWAYLRCCFLGSFCGLGCFFPICKILLQFVLYEGLRLSLPDNCSSLSTCEIRKSTYCSCLSGHPSSQLPQVSLRALLLLCSYTAYLISFFPLSFWEWKAGTCSPLPWQMVLL